MWLERLILKRAEKQLSPYRLQAGLLKKRLATEYQKYLPRINDCYEKATYWHGTGRYHYVYSGESRYESVSAEETFDVLNSIISNNGLLPHFDPWIDSGGRTVSLGTVRAHARLYARIRLCEHSTLLYECGSVQYWIRLYVLLLLLWFLSDQRSCFQVLKSLCRRSASKDLQAWASAVRKPQNGKVIRVQDFIMGEIAGSDIEGNYPVLIGVVKGNLNVIEALPLVHALEVRSLDPITLKSFTHVEVPFERVRETEELLRGRGVVLEVLPMEFVDMFLSHMPVRNLAYT